jgi:hypothetical protein
MFLAALVFPFLLLALALVMEHVERPLRDRAVGDRVVEVLGHGHAVDVEHLVVTHTGPVVDRYWRRRNRLTRLRPGGQVGDGSASRRGRGSTSVRG